DVVDLDQPGQGGGGGHGALVVQVPVGGRCQGRRPVRVGDGDGGGHVAHSGVIAVVGDGAAGRDPEVVDSIKPLDLAGGVQLGVDHFLFGAAGQGGGGVFLCGRGGALGSVRRSAGIRGALRRGRGVFGQGRSVRGKGRQGGGGQDGRRQDSRGGAAGERNRFHRAVPSLGCGWTISGSIRYRMPGRASRTMVREARLPTPRKLPSWASS